MKEERTSFVVQVDADYFFLPPHPPPIYGAVHVTPFWTCYVGNSRKGHGHR